MQCRLTVKMWHLQKKKSSFYGRWRKILRRFSAVIICWTVSGGYDYFGDSRTVDSHIKRLRAKLDKYEHPLWEIKTIWGVGYRFEGHKDE